MKILFIDTSLSNLVIGIVVDNKLLHKKVAKLNNELSIYTLPFIEEVFDICNIKPNDVDIVMVVNGPGSFTGVRIGVTVAKTFAWTLNKKVIPISSLKALAISCVNYDYVVTIIDAKSNSYYAAIYDSDNKTIMEEKHISKSDLEEQIEKLSGVVKINGEYDVNIDGINIEKQDLDIEKIVSYYKNDAGVNTHELAPVYLKKIDAEKI